MQLNSQVILPESRKRRSLSGFTLMELLIVLLIFAIILAVNFAAYNRYEARYRLYAVAEILAMDLKLQMQRARTLDEQQGIVFLTRTRYKLGKHPVASPYAASDFEPSNPPREINLSQEFGGITIDTIDGYASFPGSPAYVYFSPSTAGTGNIWTPMSGFTGEIILRGGKTSAHLVVKSSKEIVITID